MSALYAALDLDEMEESRFLMTDRQLMAVCQKRFGQKLTWNRLAEMKKKFFTRRTALPTTRYPEISPFATAQLWLLAHVSSIEVSMELPHGIQHCVQVYKSLPSGSPHGLRQETLFN